MSLSVVALLRRAQDRVAELLGRPPETRSQLIASMLQRDKSDLTAYWLQLIVSAAIATVGLVLGSTAVVIGAMLIAPLMEPIINLGMGLAVGSPFLVLRSVNRVIASVLLVIFGSATLVWLLPFHEFNAEISGRTSPTALDLLTAAFCALAGVYAALRPGSNTAATAAGTSIGISLVPPLCASGYGFGTATWSVAGGALLLFLTNFVAIVFVSTLAFLAAGMNQVDVDLLEREAITREGPDHLSRAIARRIKKVFTSRSGPLLRFAMPVILLGALYIPLRQALDQVAWQVRVRGQVEALLREVEGRIVEKRLRIERGAVDIWLVVIGTDDDVESLRATLDGRIRAASQVTPHLEIYAVPDAAQVAGIEASLQGGTGTLQPVIVPPKLPTPGEAFELARTAVTAALNTHWPVKSAGEVVELHAHLNARPLRIEVIHHGPALGEDAKESLGRALSKELHVEVDITGRSIPKAVLRAEPLDASFLRNVVGWLDLVSDIEQIETCVTEPQPVEKVSKSRRSRPAPPKLSIEERAFREALAAHPRVSTRPAEAWTIQFKSGLCAKTSTVAL